MASDTFTKHLIKSQNALPYCIAIDEHGNVWFTEFLTDKIAEISTNGTMTELAIPIASSNPTGIAIGMSDHVWFNLIDSSGYAAQFYLGSYYRGDFSFDNMTNLLDSPIGLAVDQNGTLWITQHGASLVSEFNPSTHYFRTISSSIPAATASYPYFVYTDPTTGDVWFNEHYGNAIASFDPLTNTLVEYEVPSRPSYTGNLSGSLTMAISPTGIPWFTELYTGKLGAVNTSAPLDISLQVYGPSLSNGIVSVANGSTATLQLSVSNSSNETAYLGAAIGNFTGNFALNFSKSSSTGNFSASATLSTIGSGPGVYFLTISAETRDIVVSQIIELDVR
jgi:virginiamycin B lyase